MNRDRNWRRHHNKRILQKRKNLLKFKYKFYNRKIEYLKPGYMRKSLNIYSCDCGICKKRSVSFLSNFKEKDIIGEYDECYIKK